MKSMTENEYRLETERLEKKIAFNERIHCPYVAARYRRELESLKERHEKEIVK